LNLTLLMAKSGPIIIIDDDEDDHEIYTDVFTETGVSNEVIFFTNCPDAFHYLKTTTKQSFIIFCDINLPGQNGLDFKKQIDNDPQLRQQSIPFVFISTDARKDTVTEAHTEMTIQGFFKKSSTMDELKAMISLILDYWKVCRHPNSEE
jgi:CheY-like chemotaxis protein